MTQSNVDAAGAAGGRGRTAGETQLELEWQVPPATPATSDWVCRLWAAFPPRAGRLHFSRIAEALEVSPATIRRWVHTNDPKVIPAQVRRIHQRAILRGHGAYLWPDLDPISRQRADLRYAAAVANSELIETEPERIPPEWHDNGTLQPHHVHLAHFGRAHVFGVASTRHSKSLDKIRRFGDVLETTTVPHQYAAIVLKHEMLSRVDEHRCVAPRALVPTGRTETWREGGGPTGFVAPLEVTVVHFAGLPRHRRLARALQEISNVHVTSVEATDAEMACAGLTRPADVVVLSSPAYTPSTWREHRTRRPWPGGSWYAGGRGATAGMSLLEFLEGVRRSGGLRATLLVLDAPTPPRGRVRPQLRALAADTGCHLALRTSQESAWQASVAQLVELVTRTEQDRQNGPETVVASLPHYQLG